jgi:hypothetical protein
MTDYTLYIVIGAILLVLILAWIIFRKINNKRKAKANLTNIYLDKAVKEFGEAERRYKDSNYKLAPQQILWDMAKENMKGGAEYGERIRREINGTGKPEAKADAERIPARKSTERYNPISEGSIDSSSDKRTEVRSRTAETRPGYAEDKGRDKSDRKHFEPII